MPHIVVADPIHPDGIDRLLKAPGVTLDHPGNPSPGSLAERLRHADGLIVRGTVMNGGEALSKFDAKVVDGGVNGAAWLTRYISTISIWWDKYIVDGLVRATAFTVQVPLSLAATILQTGKVQLYALSILTGLLPRTHGAWDNGFELDERIGEGGAFGMLNAVYTALTGRAPVAWTAAAQLQPWNNLFLIVILIWLQTGYAMVLFSAALKGIPSDIIEAGRVDGANEVQIFFQIMIPYIQGTIVAVGTTIIIFTLKIFDVVWVMTGGQFSTQVIATQFYREYFTAQNSGYGSAIAIVHVAVPKTLTTSPSAMPAPIASQCAVPA